MNKFAYAGPGVHGEVIQSMVKHLNCQTYLELGVYDGETFDLVAPYSKRSIGVDIKDLRKNKHHEFYMMTTDQFFEQFHDSVDIAFIDADHTFEQVKKDFENVLKLLSEFGIIFLHDTDPIDKMYLQPGYCNDCYKILDYIETVHPELELITLPITIAGLTIVKRKKDRRLLKF